MVSIGTFLLVYGEELGDYSTAAIVFIGALLAYLQSNAKLLQPAGWRQAGSRAMGFSSPSWPSRAANPFAFLLAALVFIVDGSLGILKISQALPPHQHPQEHPSPCCIDHVRKRMGWSDEQVVAFGSSCRPSHRRCSC